MEIRFAVEADYDCIEEIAKEAQQYHVSIRPDVYLKATGQIPVISEQQYKEITHSKSLVVCAENGIILAYMAFEDKLIMNPLMRKQKTLYINSLSVTENHRQRGISRMLMSWIKQYATENKYEKIELQVNDRNDIARQLYATEGFTNKSINMELFLD